MACGFKRDKKNRSIKRLAPEERRKCARRAFGKVRVPSRTIVFRKDLEENLMVCPKCHFHFRMNAKQRLENAA